MWDQNAKEPEFEFMLFFTSTRLSHFHAWGCELLGLWLKALEWPIRVSQIGHKEYQQGVCVTLWPCHSKYLKAKEELWKFKYFTMQKHNLQKKSS